MQLRLYAHPEAMGISRVFRGQRRQQAFRNAQRPAIEIFADRYCPSPYDLNQCAGAISFRWAQ